jgi:hypothetical protein
MATGPLFVQLTAKPKWWFVPAFHGAAWACALTSLVSERAADRLSDKLSGALAHFAFFVETRLVA